MGALADQANTLQLIAQRAGLTKEQVNLLEQGEAGLTRMMLQAAQAGNGPLAESYAKQLDDLKQIEQQTGITRPVLTP